MLKPILFDSDRLVNALAYHFDADPEMFRLAFLTYFKSLPVPRVSASRWRAMTNLGRLKWLLAVARLEVVADPETCDPTLKRKEDSSGKGMKLI